MPRPLAWLTAVWLTACSAQTAGVPDDRNVLAAPASLTASRDPAATAPAIGAQIGADPAAETRGFFFTQAELFQSGANLSGNTQLADVMRAMGRSDLVEALEPPAAGFGCPRPWVEPIDMIARAAARHQVVLIETDRNAPAQLAFAEGIVTRLASEGFSVYADDGLSLGPGGAAHTDVLLVTEGVVTRDTSFGRLMRRVKGNGLALVDAGVWWSSAQELSGLAPSEQAARRTVALASQVNRRVFTRDPKARVIVHTERSSGAAAVSALRADLEARTGEAPLMIALTTCLQADAQPAFVPDMGSGAAPADGADLVFAIPVAPMMDGRQSAGLHAGEVAVTVPDPLLPSRDPALVEARRVSDPDLAVPEDRLLLYPGDGLPLLLSPGSYRLESWTKNGPLAEPVLITVE